MKKIRGAVLVPALVAVAAVVTLALLITFGGDEGARSTADCGPQALPWVQDAAPCRDPDDSQSDADDLEEIGQSAYRRAISRGSSEEAAIKAALSALQQKYTEEATPWIDRLAHVDQNGHRK